MLRNYLTIAYRNLKRNKAYTLINVGGLAVGLACCILIALYVRDELSHDDFHEHAERIIFVGKQSSFGGEMSRGTSTPSPLAGALEAELPGVEETMRMLYPGTGRISRDEKWLGEAEGTMAVEPAFFEIFSFPLVTGDPQTALRRPNTVVISEELAQRYFPSENPIGQTLQIAYYGEHTYEITGVARSRDNSYLDFNALLSFSTFDYAENLADSWRSSMFLTFALLREGASEEAFDEQAVRLAEAHLGEDTETRFFAQPLTGLYLSDLISADGFRGEWRYIYLFGAVAVFILLIACVNYVNLSTARAAERAREVGVRKTVGATRFQLARQFLGESVLMSAGAFLLALLLAQAALPAFNYLFGMELSFAEAGIGWLLLLGAAALGVGVLAGSYPALYLSGFEPTRVLKGYVGRGRSGAWLRKGLVVLQFAVAVALLIGTAVVFQQLHYTQQKDLGFEGEQVVTTSVPDEGSEAFRREVLAHPGVASATVANAVPGRFYLTFFAGPDAVSSDMQADTSKSIAFHPAFVDYQYVETLGMELVAGRDFSRERPSDEERAYLLNETAVEALGWTPEEAIGKSFSSRGDTPGEVIGVVKDFHTESLHERIEPVVIQLHEVRGMSASSVLAARLTPDAIQAGLRHIEEVRARFTDEPFEYTFLDAEFAEMYRTERRLGQVFGGFAGIAILLACLGLFGLAAFAAERRTKEIGIRKVLGASVTSIVMLLSKDFLKLVVVAFVIAVPVAYFAMSRWLEDFAYRIEIGPWLFVGAGVLALVIALATVSYQAVKAALADPVDALRSE